MALKKCFFLLLLAFCSLALRCASSAKLESATVNQEDIFQQYSIRRTADSLDIRALFRLHDRNGDTLALNAPSHVSFNDKEMPRRDGFMIGATYVADDKTYQATNSFTFTNTKGKTYTNSISLEPVKFATSSLQLKKTAANAIPVSRIVKDEDTRVVLTIREQSQKDFSSEVHGGRGVVGFRSSVYFDEAKKAIVIEPDFLKAIAVGNVTISLTIRKENYTLEQATARGGEIIVEYNANPMSAKLSDK
ncbi:MAG: hypothetical protein AB1757_26990 [Acidobacteriota bacterium]